MVQVSKNADVAKLVSRLKTRPTTDELNSILTKLSIISNQNSITDLQLLELASTLINTIIPETYSLLEESIKNRIVKVMINRVCISQLTLKIRSDPKNSLIYATILANIVTTNDFKKLFSNVSQTKARDIKGLVVHKIPTGLNQAYLEVYDDNEKLNYVTRNYNKIVLDHLIVILKSTLDSIPELCLQCFVELLTNDVNNFRLILADKDLLLTLGDQKKLINNNKLFLKLIVQYLIHKVEDNNMGAYIRIIETFEIKHWDYLLNQSLESGDSEVMKLFIQLSSICNQNKAIYQQLKISLKKFGLKSFQSQISISIQEQLSKFIYFLINYSTKEQIMELSTDSVFLEAMTNRLESTLPKCRFLGMVIGDCVHEKINNSKPMFDIPSHIQDSEFYKKTLGSLEISTAEITLDQAIETTRTSIQLIKLGPEVEEFNLIKPKSIREEPVTYIDSDLEDSDDDDPSLGRKKQVTTPVYLKELISYLNADSQKDNLAFEKRELSYNITPQLIRVKKGTEELKFYSEALLDTLLSIRDNFNLASNVNKSGGDNIDKGGMTFEAWKLSSLIAVTIGDFESSVKYLIKSFVTGDLSMNTRVMILSCLSLSTRELTHGDQQDGFVLGKNKITNLGPQLLPYHIHQQFLEFEDEPLMRYNDYNEGDDTIQKALNKVSGGLKNLDLRGGKITRVSARLKSQEKQPKSTKTRNVSFINKQLPKLYYSLISVWNMVNNRTGQGFLVGNFSSILSAHFLKTLGLILDCAIPSCIELIEMGNEMTLIINNRLRYLEIEFQNDVFEAILFCLKTVLRLEPELLRKFFAVELIGASNLLSSIYEMELILDKSSVQNCYYLANKIKDVLT